MYYVYRTYDKDNNPLYFGSSYNFFCRMDMHHGKEWWKLVYKFEIDRCKGRNEALQVEAEAIKRELPRFNKVHHPDYEQLKRHKKKAKNEQSANS